MFKYKKKVLALSQVALQKQIFSKKKEKRKKVSLQNAVNEIEKRRRNILRSFVAKCLKRVIHFGPSQHTRFLIKMQRVYWKENRTTTQHKGRLPCTPITNIFNTWWSIAILLSSKETKKSIMKRPLGQRMSCPMSSYHCPITK